MCPPLALDMARTMKLLLTFLWLLVIAEAASLYWWVQYGWRYSLDPSMGDTLLAHDAVRFGPVTVYLGGSWHVLLVVTLLATSGYVRWKSRKT